MTEARETTAVETTSTGSETAKTTTLETTASESDPVESTTEEPSESTSENLETVPGVQETTSEVTNSTTDESGKTPVSKTGEKGNYIMVLFASVCLYIVIRIRKRYNEALER